jgi:hypothetical protein
MYEDARWNFYLWNWCNGCRSFVRGRNFLNCWRVCVHEDARWNFYFWNWGSRCRLCVRGRNFLSCWRIGMREIIARSRW